jgi:hypothetical protein
MATRDLKQIGLTASSNNQIRELADLPVFAEEQDIYRLAVAVAIGRGMGPATVAARQFVNKWRITDDASSSSGEGERLEDKERSFANMITTFYPEVEDPYRHSQLLAIPGINLLHQELVENGGDLSDVLPLAQPSTDEGNA